jgi:hypothetical protein
MMKALMNLDVADEWKNNFEKRTPLGFSVYLFTNQRVKSSDGLTTSGFENQPNTSYLFISNHRDILLDTTC